LLSAVRLQLRARKLHPDAQLPRFAHGPDEDAGMDLFAVEEAVLAPGGRASVGCGIALEIPPGYEGQVRPRSGLAAKHGVTLINAPGTIDPGYRGEVRVLMINLSREAYLVKPGERVAQLVIGAYAAPEWQWSETLDDSERSEGGFGSTGA
jgi:dUTP pyrophosphatase